MPDIGEHRKKDAWEKDMEGYRRLRVTRPDTRPPRPEDVMRRAREGEGGSSGGEAGGGGGGGGGGGQRGNNNPMQWMAKMEDRIQDVQTGLERGIGLMKADGQKKVGEWMGATSQNLRDGTKIPGMGFGGIGGGGGGGVRGRIGGRPLPALPI